MVIVVSDTSPIRALAHLDCLTWLNVLFDSVLLPPAVVYELKNPPRNMVDVDISYWEFITIQTPQCEERIIELQSKLDLGEAEAIALAEEIKADALLMDELTGRGIAIDCHLTVIGTLGILLRAKQLGLCTNIKTLLQRLQNEINFFLSPTLLKQILEQANEF